MAPLARRYAADAAPATATDGGNPHVSLVQGASRGIGLVGPGIYRTWQILSSRGCHLIQETSVQCALDDVAILVRLALRCSPYTARQIS